VRRGGFTAIEMMAVLAVLSIFLAVALQAFSSAKVESRQRVQEADAKVLNDAVVRVQLEGKPEHWITLSNIIHVDRDAQGAIEFLRSNSYIRIGDKEN